MRRYLAFRPEEIPRVKRLLQAAAEGSSGHGPAHLLLESAAEIGFSWCSHVPGWDRPGLACAQYGCWACSAFPGCHS